MYREFTFCLDHFWIKQCLELILTVAVNGTQIQGASPSYQLASVSSVVTLADSHERTAFIQVIVFSQLFYTGRLSSLSSFIQVIVFSQFFYTGNCLLSVLLYR